MASELQTSLLTKFYCLDRTLFPVLTHPFNNLGSSDAAISLMWAHASPSLSLAIKSPLVAQPCLSLGSLHLLLFPHPQHLWLFCFQPTLYCGKMYLVLRFQGLPCNSLWTLFLSLTPVDSVGWGQGLLPIFFPKPLFLQLVSPYLHNDPTMLSISKAQEQLSIFHILSYCTTLRNSYLSPNYFYACQLVTLMPVSRSPTLNPLFTPHKTYLM